MGDLSNFVALSEYIYFSKSIFKKQWVQKSQCVLCVGATAERVTSDGPTKPVPLIFYAFFPSLTDTDG